MCNRNSYSHPGAHQHARANYDRDPAADFHFRRDGKRPPDLDTDRDRHPDADRDRDAVGYSHVSPQCLPALQFDWRPGAGEECGRLRASWGLAQMRRRHRR